MNTLVIVLIAAVCLCAAYVLYGRWLAKKWGIDPKAKTPAVVHTMVRIMYQQTDDRIRHQFSSIAGAGPVTELFRRQLSDGFLFFSGLSWAESSLEP